MAFSRQRRTIVSQIPIRVRATSNPGGIGHDWVRDRFIERGETIDSSGSLLSPLRGFLPSKIRDNPHLDADEYEKSLSELHPHERAQLMEGDWDARPPGALFKREWFSVFESLPGKARRRLRYWDLAATEQKSEGADPDWTVGTLYTELVGAEVDYCIEDVERARKDPGPLQVWIRSVVETDGPGVVQVIEQEPGSSGKIAAVALGRDLEGYTVRFDRPTGSKKVRAGPFASAASQGRVGVLRRPWLHEWLRELEGFSGEPGPHDDQVDSASGAHSRLAVKGGTTWDDLYPAGAGDDAPAADP